MYRYLFIYIFWTGFGVHSLENEEEEQKETKYKFEYSVRDPKTGNFHSRQEERVADLLTGQYSLHDPDGYKRTVVYKVDGPSGFIASVHKERTDCPDCQHRSAPYEVGYQMHHKSPDSYVSTYFYMGSGLATSVVKVETEGANIVTKTRHPPHGMRHY